MLDGQIDVVPVAQAFETLRARFPESVLGASYAGGELVVRVRREDIVPVLRFLKHEAGFNALTDMVGIDNLKPSTTPHAGIAGEASSVPAPGAPPESVLPSGRTVEATVLPSGRTGDTTVKRFSVLYLLYRFPEACRIRIALDLDEAEPVESIVPIYRAADWAEREIFDMFGIVFNGHPDLRRIYLPDEFEGFPLRKDFPLEGKTGGV
jgi:NADH-quinone oxidoreductase subunit C